MKQFICLLVLSVLFYSKGNAQASYMDLGTVSLLINYNIEEYNNITKRKEKQVEMTAVTKFLKKEEDKIKKLHDKLHARMTSLFILLADADLLLRVGQEAQLIYQYQEEALSLAAERPYMYPAVLKTEAEIIQKIQKLIIFFTLIVNSYGDIASMKASDRRNIYSQVIIDLTIVRIKSQSMAQKFKNMSFADAVKRTRIYDMINQDNQKIQSILTELSF